MAKANTPAVAVSIPAPVTRDASVGSLILEAGQAGQTMLAKAKEAAAKAAAQLDTSKPIAERIAAVVSLYVKDFEAAGHNVKALFVDALTLHAAKTCIVSVSVIGKDGKKAEEQIPAGEAVDASKHNMRDAARQVRETHGFGRKSGGGRKPAVKAAPAAPANDATVQAADVDAFAAWLDNLDEYLADAVYHPRIVARLIEIGYSLNRSAKGVIVKGKASA